MEYTLIRTILKEGFEVTLEELRSRLIEVCKGKAEFVEALEMIAQDGICLSKKGYASVVDDGGIMLTTDLVYCGGVWCKECPFNAEASDCNLELDISSAKSYKNLSDWYSETLDLAIESCKGEEVKVEVEEVPADNPSKPLFIVTKVDDLIGLESEDGKFKICRNSNAMGVMYEAIGVKSFFPYYQFEELNLEAEQILGELGFIFTIQERKSYLELLEECEEVEFNVAGDNHYYVGRDLTTGEVRIGMVTDWHIPGIKYISREDADRIVKECVENA